MCRWWLKPNTENCTSNTRRTYNSVSRKVHLFKSACIGIVFCNNIHYIIINNCTLFNFVLAALLDTRYRLVYTQFNYLLRTYSRVGKVCPRKSYTLNACIPRHARQSKNDDNTNLNFKIYNELLLHDSGWSWPWQCSLLY